MKILFYLQLRLRHICCTWSFFCFVFFLSKKWLLHLLCLWFHVMETVYPGCKHYSCRWSVSVIPLILWNAGCVYIFMECFYCTHHWLDVWSGGSSNRLVRVSERVSTLSDWYKLVLFIIALAVLLFQSLLPQLQVWKLF